MKGILALFPRPFLIRMSLLFRPLLFRPNKVDNKHVLVRRAPRHKITKHGKVRYSLHSRTFTRKFETLIYSLGRWV